MPCLHPIERWEISTPGELHITKSTGEAKEAIAKIKPFGTLEVNGLNRADPKAQIQIIPCNRCLGCKLDKAKDMANRITLEAELYPGKNWFLTLTYDDENVPLCRSNSDKDSVIAMTLRKEDSSAFLKALRQRWEQQYNHQGIRFFCAGEYGSKTKRPHMHLCILNLPITTTMEPIGNNKRGDPLFTNQEIAKIWGKGQITIVPLTAEGAAYTARYCMKKIEPDECLPEQEQEFTVMSRRPGLGFPYYERNREHIYKTDSVVTMHGKITQKSVPPKYFDRLEKEREYDKMDAIKENRARKLILAEKLRQKNDSRDYLSYLASKEITLKQRADKLRREL